MNAEDNEDLALADSGSDDSLEDAGDVGALEALAEIAAAHADPHASRRDVEDAVLLFLRSSAWELVRLTPPRGALEERADLARALRDADRPERLKEAAQVALQAALALGVALPNQPENAAELLLDEARTLVTRPRAINPPPRGPLDSAIAEAARRAGCYDWRATALAARAHSLADILNAFLDFNIPEEAARAAARDLQEDASAGPRPARALAYLAHRAPDCCDAIEALLEGELLSVPFYRALDRVDARLAALDREGAPPGE